MKVACLINILSKISFTKYIICLFALLVSSYSFAGTTYSFVQTGYSEDAFLSGYFKAEELDFNNEYNFQEITEFNMTFSGNSLIPEFTVSLDDLITDSNDFFGLVYEYNNGEILGDGDANFWEGIWYESLSLGIVYKTAAPLGIICNSIDVCGILEFQSVNDSTTLPVVVNAVPVPLSSIVNIFLIVMFVFIFHFRSMQLILFSTQH